MQKAGALLRPLPESWFSSPRTWPFFACHNVIFIAWLDTGVLGPCHEIIGVIAVQHSQDNYGRVRFGTLLVAAAFWGPGPARAGRAAADLHHDTPQDACQSGADYVAGVDADGAAV